MSDKTRHYAFFQNRSCEYFPCHEGVDPETFNCLFCYCPLYALGRQCHGRFQYNEKGCKECTDCPIPHIPENYDAILDRYNELMARIRRMDETENA